MDKFLSLKIKTKLTFGIGLLFTMIVLLGGLAVRNITDMSSDTQNILADNYNSLLYSRRMLDALERIKNDPQAHAEFEKNLPLSIVIPVAVSLELFRFITDWAYIA